MDPRDQEGGDRSDEREEQPPRRDSDSPRPQPGLTAPLDDVTEEEENLEPTGVMPGAGPDRDPDEPDRDTIGNRTEEPDEDSADRTDRDHPG